MRSIRNMEIYNILPNGKCGSCKTETIRRIDRDNDEFWFYPSDAGVRVHMGAKYHLVICPRCKQLICIDNN